MKNAIKIGATVGGVSTRTDKSVCVKLVTQEITPDVAGELYRLQNAFVYAVLKEEDFGRDEIEAIEALEAEFVDDKKKTSSQRLRAVLYRVWQEDDKGFDKFNSFYLSEMERVIEHFKSKLP